MEAVYLDRLPADVTGFVRAIERDAGIEIAVSVNPNRQLLACLVDERSATIEIPSPDYFPEASVLHEALHIQRLWVERIPKLVVCEEEHYRDVERAHHLEKGLCVLDNNIEHLAIVPEELRLRPPRLDWWRSRFQRKLDELEADQFGCDDIKRNNSAFVIWVSIMRLLGEGELLGRARKTLQAMNLLDRAEELQEKIIEAAGSKEGIVRIWLRAIDLPVQGVCFRYIDTHSRSVRDIPVMNS